MSIRAKNIKISNQTNQDFCFFFVSWQYQSILKYDNYKRKSVRGNKQVSFVISIFEETKEIFTSAKIKSSKNFYYLKSKKIKPLTYYNLRITIEDELGSFETEDEEFLSDIFDFSNFFIVGQASKKLLYLKQDFFSGIVIKKDFSLNLQKKYVKKAFLVFSSPNILKLFVNNNILQTTDCRLSTYDSIKYSVIDISKHVGQENCIAFELFFSYFNDVTNGIIRKGDGFGAGFLIKITYSNGETEEINSKSSYYSVLPVYKNSNADILYNIYDNSYFYQASENLNYLKAKVFSKSNYFWLYRNYPKIYSNSLESLNFSSIKYLVSKEKEFLKISISQNLAFLNISLKNLDYKNIKIEYFLNNKLLSKDYINLNNSKKSFSLYPKFFNYAKIYCKGDIEKVLVFGLSSSFELESSNKNINKMIQKAHDFMFSSDINTMDVKKRENAFLGHINEFIYCFSFFDDFSERILKISTSLGKDKLNFNFFKSIGHFDSAIEIVYKVYMYTKDESIFEKNYDLLTKILQYSKFKLIFPLGFNRYIKNQDKVFYHLKYINDLQIFSNLCILFSKENIFLKELENQTNLFEKQFFDENGYLKTNNIYNYSFIIEKDLNFTKKDKIIQSFLSFENEFAKGEDYVLISVLRSLLALNKTDIAYKVLKKYESNNFKNISQSLYLEFLIKSLTFIYPSQDTDIQIIIAKPSLVNFNSCDFSFMHTKGLVKIKWVIKDNFISVKFNTPPNFSIKVSTFDDATKKYEYKFLKTGIAKIVKKLS